MKIIRKQGSEFPGYKKVDYIEYNGTQQIDTGVYPDDTTVVQCKFVMTHYNGDAFIGSKGTGESNSFRFFRAGDGQTYLDYGSGLGGNRIHGTYITSTTTIYECEFGNCYVKDLTTGTIKFSGSTASFNEKTFTIKIGDTLEYGIIYWCKIYKGGALVRDYIPVISDSTNMAGLLDKVNMVFYPDANNHNFTYGQIIDEEDKYYWIKKSSSINVNVVGTPTISNDFIVSNFSTTSYVSLPNINIDTTQSWEINLCFTTQNDISTRQKVLGMSADYRFATVWFRSSKLYGEIPSTNGSSWNIASENTGYYTISVNTKYYIKITFNGNNGYKFLVSTDNNSWTTVWTVTSTKKMYNPNGYGIWLGQDQDSDAGVKNRYLRGTIDLKICNLKSNDNIVWQGVIKDKYYGIKSSNILYQPSLDGTEAITTMSGQDTPIITNNMLAGGSGYLTQGWDNTGLWKLTFKAYSTSSSTVINNGIIICPPSATQRNQNEFLITNGGSIYIYSNGSNVLHDRTVENIISCYQTWTEYTITKTSPTTINISNGTSQVNITWNALSSYNKICIGVDKWSTDYIGIKDISVTKI